MKQRCLFNHFNKWLYLIDIQDVLECNEQYFDTKVLSADRDYMQRWPLKTIEQQDFLIDKLKINIQAEKDRLRRRRRRSSTMWETRLKDAQKVAMKSNPFLS